METKTQTNDLETRQRLLDAAAQLFADRGYNHVTVRDICQAADANVAAVNYYFRDKWGLYLELVEIFIRFMQEMNESAYEAGEGATPEDRLRHYVRTVLQHVLTESDACWPGRLMARELSDPSPALDLIVDRAIRPNSIRVATLVSEIMGAPASAPQVGMCVGSIQTQIHSFANPIAKRLVGGRFTPEIIEALAEHVAEFSLAGIRAIGQKAKEAKR